ncbi:MAG: hypothetical protein FWG40_03130 [Peptococcaceae bacterium]|nr:hypothetical protein [Peptococcaceae bacterium]
MILQWDIRGSASPSITRGLGWEGLKTQRVVPVSVSRADILQSCRYPSVVLISFSRADILQSCRHPSAMLISFSNGS